MSTPATVASPTIFRESGLVVVFGLTVLYVAVVLLAPGSVLQIPLGVLELLFAPGYAIAAMVFVRRPLLPPAAEFSVSVGLSVVFNVLIGLLLVLFGAGVEINYLALADVAATLAGLAVYAARGTSPGTHSLSSAIRRELALPSVRPSLRPAVYALLIATLVAFSAVVYVGVSQTSSPPPTSLALLGPTGTTSSVPTALVVGQVGLVMVQVQDGYSPGALGLTAAAALVGVVPHNTSTPWSLPLTLYPGTTSTLALTVTYGGETTVNVTFEFPQPGNYTLTFSLGPMAGGPPLLGTGMGLTVQP